MKKVVRVISIYNQAVDISMLLRARKLNSFQPEVFRTVSQKVI